MREQSHAGGQVGAGSRLVDTIEEGICCHGVDKVELDELVMVLVVNEDNVDAAADQVDIVSAASVDEEVLIELELIVVSSGTCGTSPPFSKSLALVSKSHRAS